jgi:hypothetical protein
LCKGCDCRLEGTVGNLGCNKYTGLCYSCKRYVAGAKCDQCKSGFYGLSFDNQLGCLPCDCSPIGSHSTVCNPETGQCSCKPHMSGRRCDTNELGYFCPSLDYLTYEAEYFERINSHSQVQESSTYDTDYLKYTGIGHMVVYDGGMLRLVLNHTNRTGLYDIVLRYTSYNYYWSDLRVRIVNLGRVYAHRHEANIGGTLREEISCASIKTNNQDERGGDVPITLDESRRLSYLRRRILKNKKKIRRKYIYQSLILKRYFF